MESDKNKKKCKQILHKFWIYLFSLCCNLKVIIARLTLCVWERNKQKEIYLKRREEMKWEKQNEKKKKIEKK